ncbi:MAG: pilus assembly PilX N-terminal domain-containing protein [Magnetococcales bacterium]|nr:pilus assembly PilX N-terminal domain-containing protein [Magnetococcales bacterium]
MKRQRHVESSSPPSRDARGMAHPERGAVVILSIMFLMMFVTMLGLTASNSSVQDLRMSSNAIDRVVAHETAQAGVDVIVSDTSYFTTSGGSGYTVCSTHHPSAADTDVCDVADLTVDEAALSDDLTYIEIKQTATGSSAARSMGTSAELYEIYSYQVTSTYDATANKGGKTGIVQGIQLVVSK